MKAEYDEENHKLMKSIWDNITDINNIKNGWKSYTQKRKI